MVWLSILREFPLGRLSMVIPKTSTICLENSSDPISFMDKDEYNKESRSLY